MHKVRNFFINVTRLNLVKSVSSEFSPQIRCICAKTSKSNVILNKSTFVAKTTGLSKKKALTAILSHEEFKSISVDSMKKSFDVLKSAGYASSIETYPELLSIPEAILKNRILLLQECGFNNHKIPWLLLDFKSLPNKQISTLRNFGILPIGVNVIENCFRVCNIPLEENNLHINEWDSFKDVYRRFCEFYLKRELEFDEEAIQRILKPIKWTSFRNFRYNIKILRDVFGFGFQEFIAKKYLLHADPENILSLLKLFNGGNMKNVVKGNPRLALVPQETVSRNHQILLENNVSEAVPCFSRILALKSDLNFYRLSKVLETYALQSYISHPRFLTLLSHAHIAQERLHILRKMNMRCYTLNQLSCPDKLFARHLAHGVDKVQCRDMVEYLTRQIPYTKSEVKAQLKKHPYVGYIPLHVVRETTDLLKEMNFSHEDIFNSLPIVLYDRRIVKDALLNQVPKLLNSLDYVDDPTNVKKKTFLALAFYCIEKVNHFTGSGVWNRIEESQNEHLFIEDS